MEDDKIPTAKVSDWQPITDKVDLAYLGKTGEELGELVAALFRCIIQGILEVEPTTKKPNKQWLEYEIADVRMMFDHLVPHFELDLDRMELRGARKYAFKKLWFDSLKAAAKEHEAVLKALDELSEKWGVREVAECSTALRYDGKPYPRTCAVCGLGPCHDPQFKNKLGTATYMQSEAPSWQPEQGEPATPYTPPKRALLTAIINGVLNGQISANAAVDVLSVLLEGGGRDP